MTNPPPNGQSPAPGWYQDPQNPNMCRFWDGSSWGSESVDPNEAQARTNWAAQSGADPSRPIDSKTKKAADKDVQNQQKADRRTDRRQRWAAKSQELQRKSLLANFKGLGMNDLAISYQGQGGSLAGARASVETSGDIDRRITATRLVLTGPLALAWRKKKDQRELYLLVEGPSYAFTVPVDPDKGLQARQLASMINARSSQLAATTSQPSAEKPAAAATPAQLAPAAHAAATSDELLKLAALRDQGVLTDEEFSAAKAKLLGL